MESPHKTWKPNMCVWVWVCVCASPQPFRNRRLWHGRSGCALQCFWQTV